MFYVKEKVSSAVDVKVEIHEDNVFCNCPRCGKEVEVDIAELFSDGISDLYGTFIYCIDCSKSKLRGQR